MPQTLRGFTLIELLIVIAIIGILTTIGVGSFLSARVKARDSQRKTDLSTIAKSIEAYYNDHQSYPLSNINGEIICIPPSTVCAYGDALQDNKGTLYAAKIPPDPSTQKQYFYFSDGNIYTIYANLENSLDSEITTTTVSCGTGTLCNYLIKSSNQI